MDIDSHFRVPDSTRSSLFIMWLFKAIPYALVSFLIVVPGVAFSLSVYYTIKGSPTPGSVGFATAFHGSIPIVIALWLYMAYEQSLKKINKAEREYRDLATRLKEAGVHLDYWYALPRCALGVDLSNKKIAFGTLNRKNRPGPVVTMPIEKITRVKTRKLTPNEVKVYGLMGPVSGAYVNSQVKAENQRARDEATSGTGLVIHFDDIDVPEAFLVMPMEHAKKWLLVIEKACKGTLEREQEPRYFPKLDWAG